jgi:hypothetical protein
MQARLTDFSDCRTHEDMELTHLGTLKTLLSEVLLLARDQRLARKEVQIVLGRIQQMEAASVNMPAAAFGYRETSTEKTTAVAADMGSMLSAMQTLTDAMARLLQSQTSDLLKSSTAPSINVMPSENSSSAQKFEVQNHAPGRREKSSTLQRRRFCLQSIDQETVKVKQQNVFTTSCGDLCQARTLASSNSDSKHNDGRADSASVKPPAIENQLTGSLASNVLVERRGRRAAADQPISMKQGQWPSFRKALGTSRRKSLASETRFLEQDWSTSADSTVVLLGAETHSRAALADIMPHAPEQIAI